MLPPHNWHMRVNTQRARDGEIRDKGDSSIKDQRVWFRDHTLYDMWANPMGNVYVGPGIKEESSGGSSMHTPTLVSAQQRTAASKGAAALHLTMRMDPLIGGINIRPRTLAQNTTAPTSPMVMSVIAPVTNPPIAPPNVTPHGNAYGQGHSQHMATNM